MTEYENRIAMLSQEVERLNEVLKTTRTENDRMRRELAQGEQL
jgi:uncharacterized small protein (DUF1192 family)